MRRIIEVSNECSPGTKENWYEVLNDEGYGRVGSLYPAHVATFYTKDDLEVYLKGLDTNKYKYEIIPYESNE